MLSTVPPALRVVRTNEKVTGPPAAELLRRSAIYSSKDLKLEILDNATGGSVLVAELLRSARRLNADLNIKRIVAGDIDDKMLEAGRDMKDSSIGAEPTWSKVEIVKIDQQVRQAQLPFPALSNLL